MHRFGEERLAPVNGIELCYQEMGDPQGEPLLLVMGLATQMLAWDEEFCAMLVERGFRVVRFDNRDIGRSSRIDRAGVPGKLDMLLGRRATAPYLLRDMAADAFGLMDHLGIDSAHLVGASMGGMIVQTAAIDQPRRVRSLVSIMSTTGSHRVGHPSYRTFGLLLGRPPREREAAIERVVKTFRTIGSPGYPFEEERIRELAGRSFDRGHSEAGIARQLHAITASGDRTKALGRLELPATVIHGKSDILVKPSGGRATAAAIPGARLRMVEGMGHDLPRALWPSFAKDIAATAARAPQAAPAIAS
ncbi:MAG TPA: alpha/beta fold hydrolase [Solirubrobacterales bacterium]|nr:alpha/beta fold hydrolase [Solirubrobacterales bacterium]